MAKKRITIHDKTFELTIPEATILEAVRGVADRIRADYEDKDPIFVVVLNGAFVFAADLLKMIDFPCSITFTKVASYAGTASCGTISEQLPVTDIVSGRHVIIVEDIIEKGHTMDFLLRRIGALSPASVAVCVLSFKPEKVEVPGLEEKIRYVGMCLPEAFIVGYGLDYDQRGRNLRDIYSLVGQDNEP